VDGGSFRFRARIAGAHLVTSLFVVGLAAALVFGLWYPAGLAELSGGANLFMLLATIDAILGPTLTAIVAERSKPRRELIRDIAIIGAVQLAALVYGLSVIAQARPVAVVWEIDLFRVVTAGQIDAAELQAAPTADLRRLPWTGPLQLSVAKPTDAAEQLRTIELALNGVPLSALPRHWRPRADAQAQIDRASRPLDELLLRLPDQRARVVAIAKQAGLSLASLRWAPIEGRAGFWAALIPAGGDQIIGYVQHDPGN